MMKDVRALRFQCVGELAGRRIGAGDDAGHQHVAEARRRGDRIFVSESCDLYAFAFRHRQSFAKSIGLLRSSVAVTFGIGYFRPVAQLNSTQRSVFFTRPSASAAL